jgi:DNA-binding MarR family transcriptional regulator
MRIDDKIKQREFRNEYHRLLANLTHNYSRILSESQRILKSFGVSFQQFNVLSILRGQYPNNATVNLIKERIVDQSSDVSRIVDRLVQKKLVSRNVCPHDRRRVDVLITQKGIALLARLDKENSKIDNLVSNLSPGEAKKLNQLLDKLGK